MADTKTFGLKVPEELHKEASNIMKLLDLSGEDFLNEMIRSYKSEKTKEKIPLVAKDLKELQVLTGRIYDMYLNLSYGIENISRSKEDEMNNKLEKKDSIIISLQDKVNELTEKEDMLTSSFNNAIEDKNNLDKQVHQLTEVIESNKALITEYKEKNDTLTGLVNEYKSYKTEIEEYKKLLADSQSRNIELENIIKDKEFELTKLNDAVSDLKAKNEAELDALNVKHKDERISLTNRIEANEKLHKYDIQVIKDKAEFEKDKALLDQDRKHQESINKLNEEHAQKVKELLNLLEESKKQHQEPKKKPTFYGKCKKCGTPDDWEFIKSYDKNNEHHEVLKCNSCGNEVDVPRNISNK